MQLTPAIKGQLTKAAKRAQAHGDVLVLFRDVRRVYEHIMPREQAKHAARKYLRGVC